MDSRFADLIARAQGGGGEAGDAAMALLEAFINGDRSPLLADYIAQCLGAYLRGGIPIELALHLSRALPPILLGPAGEGDRRRAQRGGPSRSPEAAGKQSGRGQLGRETQGGRSRTRRPGVWDKAAPEKRARPRTGPRRKAATRAPGSE